MKPLNARKAAVVAICLGVAAMHLVTGPDYRGPLRGFVTGHLMDVLLPFAMTLLLGMGSADLPFHVPAAVRGGIVVLFGVVVETAQARGVALFGRTADPLDVLAYLIGAVLALAFERGVLARLSRAT